MEAGLPTMATALRALKVAVRRPGRGEQLSEKRLLVPRWVGIHCADNEDETLPARGTGE